MATQNPAQSISSLPTAALPLTRGESGDGAGNGIKLIAGAEGAQVTTSSDGPSLLMTGASLRLPASCARMPVALAVAVPVREFRVRNLLAMAPGALIETQWGQGEDLPLSSSDVQLAWSEFEVVDTRLAVRVTRLS